jgi:hypothetical protein
VGFFVGGIWMISQSATEPAFCGEGAPAACDEAALSRREHADKSANNLSLKSMR